jgi:glucosylceramidase
MMRKNFQMKAEIKPWPVICIIFCMITIQCSNKSERLAVFTSSLEGDRLTRQDDIFFTADIASALPVITVNEDSIFQKIDGFGASFNEAGMICLNALQSEEKENVLKSLFDPNYGAGFSLMKSPLGACDFASAGPWFSHNDGFGDTLMTNFSIERDLGPNGQIAFIKSARKYGVFELETPMDFAPDWMYADVKKGDKTIRKEYYPALALYLSKFVKAYAENGVIVDYLPVFNEPGCYTIITLKEIGELMKNHIGPLFKAEGLTTKLQLGQTMQRDEALRTFPPVINDSTVAPWISGPVTFHGYDYVKFSDLTELHKQCPGRQLWMTEICYASSNCWPPSFTGLKGLPKYEFSDGEFWGNMIVNDMKNWVSGWIYWNMILDQNGGPWLVSDEHGDPNPNIQHPVVIVNRETKRVDYTGLYYYLSHFSKFVRPGAYRIDCSGGSPTLNFVGFVNTDNNIILNVINNGDETECKILWKGKMTIQKLKAHSITTLKWNKSI